MNSEATGRGLAYRRIADLIEGGPELAWAELITADTRIAEAATGRDEDQLAAEHYATFGRSIPPLAGAFLDRDGRAGGRETDRLGVTWHVLGLGAPPDGSEDIEHVSTQLRALAQLCLEEEEAWAKAEGGMETAAVRVARARQKILLDDHLLPWALVLCATLQDEGRQLATALGQALEAVLLGHRTELGEDDGPITMELRLGETKAMKPPPAPDLDDVRVGVGTIARWLSTPARSGVFLPLGLLERWGKELDLPRGFGTRAVVLEQLLRGSARFDQIGPLMTRLGAHVDGMRTRFSEERYQSAPIQAALEPWLVALGQTASLASSLGDRVARAGGALVEVS